MQDKIVRGENIGQTFQFVQSGNAELGFVAMSQLTARAAMSRGGQQQGSFWIPPASLYTPIEQQAVLLSDKQAARDFISYVKSAEGRAVIQQSGYDVP